MTMMNELKRRLLIVEDELLMRGLLETELTALGFIVAAVDTAVGAKKKVQQFDPDIALIDIGLKGGLSGLHFGHYLALQHPEIAQIYLTKYEDAASAASDGLGLPAGAGFVSKHYIGSTDILIDVINQVTRGQEILSPELSHVKSKSSDLGVKGTKVLELLAEGFSNQHIARTLEISPKTVEYYVDLAYKSLEISKSSERNPRVEAALRYQRLNFATDRSDENQQHEPTDTQ